MPPSRAKNGVFSFCIQFSCHRCHLYYAEMLCIKISLHSPDKSPGMNTGKNANLSCEINKYPTFPIYFLSKRNQQQTLKQIKYLPFFIRFTPKRLQPGDVFFHHLDFTTSEPENIKPIPTPECQITSTEINSLQSNIGWRPKRKLLRTSV